MAFSVTSLVLMAGLQVAAGIGVEISAYAHMTQRSHMAYGREVRRMKAEAEASIKHLMETMTLDEAINLLKKSSNASELLQTVQASMAHEVGKVSEHKFLAAERQRAGQAEYLAQPGAGPTPSPDAGYAGVDKAVTMVNEMITEVEENHDGTTQFCKGEFEDLCSQMEDCREAIAVANSDAADARACILNQQKTINENEELVPRLRENLRMTEDNCHRQREELEDTLKIVLADIEVMKSVLKMTECSSTPAETKADVTGFTQLRKGEMTFKHLRDVSQLANLTDKLQSEKMKTQLLVALQSFVREEPMESTVTKFENPSLPQEPIPGNPCEGITFDAGGEAGCKIDGPKCWKLQDKFLLIQGGIIDERDRLTAELAQHNKDCAAAIATLREQIRGSELALSTAQTKLAECTAQENSAAQAARLEAEHHQEVETQMLDTRQDCTEKLRAMETEKCGLTKIRSELEKIEGNTDERFFKDCVQSEWAEEECSASCAGGQMKLTRTIIQQPFNGAECLPSEAYQKCNMDPCPVDCELGDWSGWSACSAECGGGVLQRAREVIVQPEHSGEPCGEKTEAESCNIQSCAKECVLSDWTAWSECSKGCESGTTKRERTVVEAAIGGGSCAGEDDVERLNTMPCNTQGCVKELPDEPLPCEAEVDVTLILDGSSSVTAEGWDSTLVFAKTFVKAFQIEGHTANAQISVITYSGPYTWDDYYQCTDGQTTQMDEATLATTCGIKVQKHYTNDLDSLVTLFSSTDAATGLPWPTGSTMTQAALTTAAAETSNGRPGVKSVVVLVTDGQPISEYRTYYAAQALKATGSRLLIVPVQGNGLSEDAMRNLESIASWPTTDNFVNIAGGFTELAGVTSVDKIIADICPTDPCGNFCHKVNLKDENKLCWNFNGDADACNKAYIWDEGEPIMKPCIYRLDGKCSTDPVTADWLQCAKDPASLCA